jgi:hypothetical protein
MRQGSSVVEQGTHKPLVGSSTLPPGIYSLEILRAPWLVRFPGWLLNLASRGLGLDRTLGEVILLGLECYGFLE